MKLHKLNLPLELQFRDGKGYNPNYIIIDSVGNFISDDASMEESAFPNHSIEYIVESINNYSTVIRFVKEAVKYMYPTGVKNEINEFLTKIENNENT